MKLTIKCFGITRDITGEGSIEVITDHDIQVHELRKLLFDKYPSMQTLQSLAVAVNEEYARDDDTVHEMDDIVLIPPVSGG